MQPTADDNELATKLDTLPCSLLEGIFQLVDDASDLVALQLVNKHCYAVIRAHVRAHGVQRVGRTKFISSPKRPSTPLHALYSQDGIWKRHAQAWLDAQQTEHIAVDVRAHYHHMAPDHEPT